MSLNLSFVADFVDVQPIYDGHGLQIGPTLRSWSMDMDQGLMTLLLSRPLDLDSVELRVITLLNAGYVTSIFVSYVHRMYIVCKVSPVHYHQAAKGRRRE